jgi:mannose-6-phosphate isomerase-like protein (cupin superfamily)
MTFNVEPIVILCRDLEKTLESFVGKMGFRLDMIVPADSPSTAFVSGHGLRVKLSKRHDDNKRVISNADEHVNTGITVNFLKDSSWIKGRAGMEYRDLIPDRACGRIIASYIRLGTDGEVADYVHYHKVKFQMIYCLRGRIRVVYEDQGPPFWLEAGDCVLQPPEIRHRVLESFNKAEVVEIGVPAVHETWVEYEMELPTAGIDRERCFSGQRFVRHMAHNPDWLRNPTAGFEYQDTAISKATGEMADVRILRASIAKTPDAKIDDSRSKFLFVIKGELFVNSDLILAQGDSLFVPEAGEHILSLGEDAEVLSVSIAL